MIIEPRISLTGAELQALRSRRPMDVDLALRIVDKIRNAVRTNSYNNVEFSTTEAMHAVYPSAISVVEALERQPYVQVETDEGLKPAFACVAEDGSRAVVIALDPIAKYPIEGRPNMEVIEELIWLKGETVLKEEDVAPMDKNEYDPDDTGHV